MSAVEGELALDGLDRAELVGDAGREEAAPARGVDWEVLTVRPHHVRPVKTSRQADWLGRQARELYVLLKSPKTDVIGLFLR